ncbi:MAG: DUF4097 family beta strand repeat-containing protein [Angelakisella sp.]
MKIKQSTLWGAALLGAGSAIFFLAFALGGFDIARLSTQPPYLEKQFVSAAAVEQIRIDDSNMPLTFGVSPDSRVHVTYYENEKEFYQIQDGSTLSFAKMTHWAWYDHFFNFTLQETKMTILVPKNYRGSITAKTANGAIEVQELAAQELRLRTSNGQVNANSLRVGGLCSVESSNGQVTLSDLQAAGKLEVHSSNGAILGSGWSAQAMAISSTNGRIELENAAAQQSIAIDTSNGAIILQNVTAQNAIDAQTFNDAIHLNELAAGQGLTLTSSNGAIMGSIVGRLSDFTGSVRTSNSESNLPETMVGGAKQLEVHTSNGAIQIEFTEQ